MQAHGSSLRYLPLGRLGTLRFGVSSSWLPAQAIGLVGFGVLASATVAGHLGQPLDLIGSLRVALVLLLAVDLTVLVHEAGHALVAAACGVTVRAVVLMAYGGATIREATADTTVARWTAAGGPLANIAAAGVCLALLAAMDPHSALACVLMIAG